jgi:UbiA prenyltransferase family
MAPEGMPRGASALSARGGLASMGARFADCVAIARPDHWFKNIFMLPGAALGFVLTGGVRSPALLHLLVGVISTCLIASANYTINEWLDAESDRHHPEKRHRPSAAGRITASLAYGQWLLLAVAGLGLALMVSRQFAIFSVVLLAMGAIYNIKPLRTKDRQYLDGAHRVGEQSAKVHARLECGGQHSPAAVEHSPCLLDGRRLPYGGQALRRVSFHQ